MRRTTFSLGAGSRVDLVVEPRYDKSSSLVSSVMDILFLPRVARYIAFIISVTLRYLIFYIQKYWIKNPLPSLTLSLDLSRQKKNEYYFLRVKNEYYFLNPVIYINLWKNYR